MSEELAVAATGDPRCLSRAMGCPSPAEWDLLRYGHAMDTALRMVRFTIEAEACDGMVPAASLLRALNEPYHFPLPADTEVLAAYRKVYGDGDRAIRHLAQCGRCDPVGYDREFCKGYESAAKADWEEAYRERGGWPPWERPRRGEHEGTGSAS